MLIRVDSHIDVLLMLGIYGYTDDSTVIPVQAGVTDRYLSMPATQAGKEAIQSER